MAVQQFKLPDLGEGLTEGDILKWTVAVGDTVEVNDTIAEVETVKAAVELPSPFAGVVTGLHAAEGETVPVGTPIISIEVGGAASATDSDVNTPEDARAAEDLVPTVPAQPGVTDAPAPKTGADDEQQMTLVGYGPRAESGGRRRRRHGHLPEATAAGAQVSFNLPPSAAAHSAPEPQVEESAVSDSGSDGAAVRVLAKPPVRKLAKTLGVSLADVAPSGPHGTITRADVEAASQQSGTGASVTPLPIHRAAPGDRETRLPVKGVRKHTAAAMVGSAFTAPHVTEFITLDVTATMDLRDRVAARREFRDVKVSPLLFVAKAVLLAAKQVPEINASWVDSADGSAEIVVKHYVNLGIAAATDRGLIVPNIKDADQLSLLELAQAINALTGTARAGRTAPADMSGGTFTITNVGVFGVDTGTPILNPGEAGILAFGAVRRMPWVIGSGADERLEARWVTQLAVSFDHRLVDGEQGSRFLAAVAAVLGDPGMALL
ncbi:dihydrolipoamide acetyltransferase family protein [uncultured Jatrophihabitans sp.]|uniref:dihydrolipoamide acetyltransferase family protein n=1 Tax=uncultured Jatrophihabitans sp. TaxID=1610747 RepID=UPI0035CC5E92